MKYTERLARLLFYAAIVTLAFLVLHFFGSIVGYILLAFVTALIAKPLMILLRKIRIRGKSAPEGLLAIISLLVILAALVGVAAGIIPLVRQVVNNILTISSGASLQSLSASLAGVNETLRELFNLPADFQIEAVVMEKLSSLLSFAFFGSMIGSVASTAAGIGVGLFSVIFIAYFFVKDDSLFRRIVTAMTPDRYAGNMKGTFGEISHLLSRYFVGLLIEMFCVGMIDFLGLWLIVRIDVYSALGIGFFAGILNIIPYLGPLFGGVLGSLMAILIVFSSTAGLAVDFWLLATFLAAVFITAQLVDNIVLQPLIYSTSIKAHPLEIFIVLLLGGSIGGIVGMIAAIPAYTVVRAAAFHFFPEAKFIRLLSQSSSK